VSSVALTFDDGPDRTWTPRLLDVLSALNARATFFPITSRAAAAPGLLERIRDDGHTIGLHCREHVRHSDRDLAWLRDDTRAALDQLAAAGVRPTLWRTPWGDTAPWTMTVAREHELRLIDWTADTHDWRGDSAEQMLADTRGQLVDGSVVLAHDGIGPGAHRDGAAETIRYVELAAADARARGLALTALA
jgi:peptidoglycan/xylan/chitin deacetylase (PgdA/CDA1 family)